MKQIEKRIIAYVLVLLVVFSGCIASSRTAEAAEKQPRKITLNCTSKKMSVGQKYRLKVDKTKPSNASQEVIWTSSNESIATINANGLISAKATGTVTIIAQAKEADGIVAKCKVKIYKAAKKITLNHKSKTVYVGDTVKLSVKKVKPAKALKNVRWISSNKSIATVSDTGVVTTRKAGTVVITARDKGNRNVTAKCTVKIEEKPRSNSSNEPSSSNETQNLNNGYLYQSYNGIKYYAPQKVVDLFYNEGHGFLLCVENGHVFWWDTTTGIGYDENGNIDGYEAW